MTWIYPVLPSRRARSGHAVTAGWVGFVRLGGLGTRFGGNGGERRELRVTAEASEVVTVPRAELDALRAEVRRLRPRSGAARRGLAWRPTPARGTVRLRCRAASSLRRGESMSDHQVRFSGNNAWQEIEALPESVRWTVQRVIFHCSGNPSRRWPTRFLKTVRCPERTSCTCASDGVTIWYVVAPAADPGWRVDRARGGSCTVCCEPV